MDSETNEIYEFGPYRLDVGQHRFERSDGISNSSLPEKAFQTLVFLVRNQGRLVTKNELLDAIWPDTAVEENNLNKSIHAIRHALGQKTGKQKYIETVPKHAGAERNGKHNRSLTEERHPTSELEIWLISPQCSMRSHF